MSLKRTRILFLFIAISIAFFASAINYAGNNLFQWYISVQHEGIKLLTFDNLINTVTTILLMSLCFLPKFQRLTIERYFLGSLIFLLLCLPVTEKTVPIVIGLTRTIANLAQVWIQIFVPPPIRATFSSITPCLTSIIDIRSVIIEKSWQIDVFREHFVIIFIIPLVAGLWWYGSILEGHLLITNPKQDEKSLSIKQLLFQYPALFIACILFGLNSNLFSYTYFWGKLILINQNPQFYQYVMYAAMIIMPLIAGISGDRFGINRCTLWTFKLTMLCKFFSFMLLHFEINNRLFAYPLAFIEASLVASLYTLSPALIGVMINIKSIFRSFALATLIVSVGRLIDYSFYGIFSNSVEFIKLAESLVNALLAIGFFFAIKRRRSN